MSPTTSNDHEEEMNDLKRLTEVFKLTRREGDPALPKPGPMKLSARLSTIVNELDSHIEEATEQNPDSISRHRYLVYASW